MSSRLRVSSVRNLRLSIGLLLATAALVLALQFGPAAKAAPATARATNEEVAITNSTFIPRNVTITVGSSVQWTNNDMIGHTTTSDDNLWHQPLGPGEVFSTTFATPGTYNYHCAIHFFMTGRVVVVTFIYLPLIMRA